MRTLIVMLFWGFITTCYGLKVLAIDEPVMDARTSRLVSPTRLQSGDKDQHLANPSPMYFALPVVSRLSPGKVKRHTLINNPFSHPFFVIGDDSFSRTWLKDHAFQLQKNHAIGFVTNIADTNALDELTQLSGLPLQPMDIDELAAVLSVKHYPFAVESGVVWQ